MGNPAAIIAICLLWKHEVCRLMTSLVTFQWPPSIYFPVPKSEYKDVKTPEQRRIAKQANGIFID
jgi:hypothetical protein